MKQNQLAVFIITTVVLAVSLIVAIFAATFFYHNLVNYATPDISYANAKKAVVKECEKFTYSAPVPCTNLQLVDITEIDVGNDITGTDYTFKNPALSDDISYTIWAGYDGNIFSTNTSKIE